MASGRLTVVHKASRSRVIFLFLLPCHMAVGPPSLREDVDCVRLLLEVDGSQIVDYKSCKFWARYPGGFTGHKYLNLSGACEEGEWGA